jgi:predicted phosphodiesterase
MFDHMVKTSDTSTRFLIHAGDIIEGNGFNDDAQAGQFFMADSLFKEYFKIPIYMVRGNHESANVNKNISKVYSQRIAPEMIKNAGQAPGTTHYTIQCGEDLFIFVDAYNKPSDFLRETLKNLTKRPRYLFLVLHPDVLPQPQPQFLDMVKQLLPYDGIILNGHTHRNRVLKYVRDGHTVTQYTIGSYVIANTAAMRYEETKNDTAAFLKKFRNKKYVSTPAQKQLFDAEFAPLFRIIRNTTAPKAETLPPDMPGSIFLMRASTFPYKAAT